MQESVLNLGEKIVLAARLAAIEHVRQLMVEHGHRERQGVVGDDVASAKDGAAPLDTDAIRQRWAEFFRQSEREAA